MMARSRSVRFRRSMVPLLVTQMAWKGLKALRMKLSYSGSPALSMMRPRSSQRTAWAWWMDSTMPSRRSRI